MTRAGKAPPGVAAARPCALADRALERVGRWLHCGEGERRAQRAPPPRPRREILLSGLPSWTRPRARSVNLEAEHP
eukprot:9746968-Alexandrium_andersonii.AAC.1